MSVSIYPDICRNYISQFHTLIYLQFRLGRQWNRIWHLDLPSHNLCILIHTLARQRRMMTFLQF